MALLGGRSPVPQPQPQPQQPTTFITSMASAATTATPTTGRLTTTATTSTASASATQKPYTFKFTPGHIALVAFAGIFVFCWAVVVYYLAGRFVLRKLRNDIARKWNARTQRLRRGHRYRPAPSAAPANAANAAATRQRAAMAMAAVGAPHTSGTPSTAVPRVVLGPDDPVNQQSIRIAPDGPDASDPDRT